MIFKRFGYPEFILNAAYAPLGVIAVSFFLWSCQSSGSTIDDYLQDDIINETSSETILTEKVAPVRSWVIPDGPELFLSPLSWDLEHQKIWVRFDFPRQTVIGQTELFFTSISNTNSELPIDARELHIESVTNLSDGRRIDFSQDSATILLSLPKTYSFGDSLYVRIEYTARMQDRGLIFINPVYAVNWSPRQIFTWGLPENNSYWLPTINHPAERATQETWISVPPEYQTVSNGALIYSRVYEADSLRTDYWNMSKSHAPNHFAIAVGKFDVTEEFHGGVIYRYYTEVSFTPYVDEIFSGTAEMIEFFSDKLGVEYPWGIYSQVPIQHFAAGGMANTTASFLYNGVQKSGNQLVDKNYQDIRAHKLIQHWFGSLVAPETWSDMALNESFTAYLENLYLLHTKGEDALAWRNIQNWRGYFTEAQRYRRSIIFNRYTSPEELLDAHSRQKGALVLRMLHHMAGDEVWWRALNRYLTDNAFQAAGWADIKAAFEKESGIKYESFFDQWFLSPGHPEILIRTSFYGDLAILRLTQAQNLDLIPLYNLNIDIHYTDEIGESFIRNVDFFTADSVYVFDNTSGKIGEIVVDPNRIVLAEYVENLSVFDHISRLAHPSVALRYEAIDLLSKVPDYNSAMIMSALSDAFWFEEHPQLRELILAAMAPYPEYWQEWINTLNHHAEPYYQNRMLAAWLSHERFGSDGNEFLHELLDDPSIYVQQYVNLLLNMK